MDGLDGHPQSLFYLSKNNDNYFRVELVTDGGDLIQINSRFVPSLNTWYHLAAVGDTSTESLTLYVNGNSVGAVDGFDGLFDPLGNNAWTVGRGQYSGNPVDYVTGYIDEVRFTWSALEPDRFLNAFNADTDYDGLDDAWEREYFGDLSQTGTQDPDLDGADNETEESNGTPPTISSLPPVVVAVFSNGNYTLNWPDQHTGWQMEYRTNLLDGAWQPLPGSAGTNLFTVDPDAVPSPDLFFRMVYP